MSVSGEVVLPDSDCELVESQTVSLYRKREAPFVESQEDMIFRRSTGANTSSIQEKDSRIIIWR